jgi:hypothetical protein
VIAAALASATLATLATGCVDPKHDFDDWLARTADARSLVPVFDGGASDGAAGESSLPDAGFGGTYLMACLSSLNPNPAQALLFRADAQFTPAAAGGGGTLDFSQTPLVTGAQTIDDSAPMGSTSSVNGSVVALDGTCDVHVGPTTIPASADPLGAQIVFADSALHFHVSSGGLCAALSGHVTLPLDTNLDPTRSFCIFRPPTPPFPVFQSADFHCP